MRECFVHVETISSGEVDELTWRMLRLGEFEEASIPAYATESDFLPGLVTRCAVWEGWLPTNSAPRFVTEEKLLASLLSQSWYKNFRS